MDDRLGFGRTRSRTNRRGPDVLPDDAQSSARCHRKNVVYAAVFGELAYFLASRDDQHAGGLPTYHTGPAADKCARLCSVDVPWPKHAFQEVNVVHQQLSATGTAGLSEDTTCSTLRYLWWPPTTTQLIDCSPLPLGAYQFPCAASWRISQFSACWATIFFSRAFSFSRALSCLAIAGGLPPYFCLQR